MFCSHLLDEWVMVVDGHFSLIFIAILQIENNRHGRKTLRDVFRNLEIIWRCPFYLKTAEFAAIIMNRVGWSTTNPTW